MNGIWSRLLFGDLATHRRQLKIEHAQHRLRDLRRRRRRERAARMRQYAIGWCHSMALREDRARTIRLELVRLHKEQLARKVVWFTHGGKVG